MKKMILTTLTLLCVSATIFAQSTPSAVTAAFNQKFPGATNVKWDKENVHNYEASFELKDGKYSANFSDTGTWLETESPFSFTLLPEKVQTAFNTEHKGATIIAISKIETSKGEIKYEVEIKSGKKTVEVFYTTEGKEIKE